MCPTFGPAEAVGALTSPDPDETSGLVWREGTLWAVDDGDRALYALSSTGQVQGEAQVSPDVVLVDWEDLALLGDRLLVADIGDNLEARVNVRLIQFELPAPTGPSQDWPAATETVVQWPDRAHNSETVLVDPVSGDVLLVAKSYDGVSPVIRVRSPLPASALGELVATLAFGVPPLDGSTLTTGGAVSDDGTAVFVRTYLDAFVWPRVPGEDWEATFARTPCLVDLGPEPQGETIAWSPEGLYTVSEGRNATVLLHPAL